MDNNEKRFTQIVSKMLVLEEPAINNSISRKNTKSWDSLAHLMLIGRLEDNFGISLSDDDIVEIKTIADLKLKLKKHGVEIR